MIKDSINIIEQHITELFSLRKDFSTHLIKYEDNILKEKYDNNFFEYNSQFTENEFRQALAYQINRNDNFIKFFGKTKLENNYGMLEGCDLTMLLNNTDVSAWKDNKQLSFKKPSIDEIKQLELKHYGDIYGHKFTIDNVKRIYAKMSYLGAYIDNKLVGICVPYIENEYCCIDEILVDDNYRKQYVCTSLLKFVVSNNSCKYYFLHADDDDTPKNLYMKLGFETIEKKHVYQITDLKNYIFIDKYKMMG